MAYADYVIAHWKFDETSGNAVDEVSARVLAEHGTIASATGILGNGRVFDNSSSKWFRTESDSTLQTGTFTTFSVCGWLKLSNKGGDQFIVGKHDNVDGQEWAIRIRPGGGFQADVAFIIYNGLNQEASVANISTVDWHFIVAVCDMGNGFIKMSLDGSTLAGNTLLTGADATTVPLVFGQQLDGGASFSDYLRGTVDSWTLFKDYALTDADVTSLYNGGAGRDYPFPGGGGAASRPKPGDGKWFPKETDFSHYQIRKPFTVGNTPMPPPLEQDSQDVRPLPVLDDAWFRQKAHWGVPVSYTPQAPSTRQTSQDVRPLPNFNDVAFRQHRNSPIPVNGPGTPPASHQPSQDVRPQPEWNDAWYRQRKVWPVPTADAPVLTPWMKQADQRFDTLPDFQHLYWNQRRLQPLPSGITSIHLGVSGTFLAVAGGKSGSSRAATKVKGYNVYAAVASPPDLTAAPTFSATLPANVVITPPVSGTAEVRIIVRTVNEYGLESQNQREDVFVIDSNGDLVRSPVPTPRDLRLTVLPGGRLRVRATYPTYGTDADPATTWRIWGVSPSGTIDYNALPTMADVTGPILTLDLDVLSGTWSVGVKLYRGVDSALSSPAEGAAVVPPAPDPVAAVHGGYDL